jgi:hypothetical protein
MAVKYDLEVMKGDTPTFTIKTSINNTGYTFRITVKNKKDVLENDTQALLSKSWNTHVNNFETMVKLSKTDTAFASGTYKYDIQMDNSSGDVLTILYGEWKHINDITKTTS